ncbi:MAG: choice-of-anchor J domain-containing protein [Chitinophagaceae bacterium]
MKKLYTLVIALIPMLAWSQILSWNFTGAAGNETSIAATAKDANLSSSMVARGSGVTATALANAFSSSGWNVASQALAISGNKYLQFTVNALPGYQVSLSGLDAYFRRSSTGPNAFQWQYSLDNFATAGTDFGPAISYTATTSNGDPQAAISSAGISALQNVPSSTTVTLRLYGWGASAAGGTFALGRPANASLAVGGAVTPVAGSTPGIFVTPGSLTGFTTISGTASSPQSVTASASNLTTDITVTPTSPYEISVDGGATYTGAPVVLSQTAGSVGNTPITIRIAATATPGITNGNITFVSAGAATQTVELSGTVSSGLSVDPPAAFSATGLSISSIGLLATANAANDNIVVASNTTASFGVPAGTLVAGNSIAGGGTVLYNGPAAAFNFTHNGLSSGTTYFYQAWSVDVANTYSTPMAANASTITPTAANVVINQVYGGGGNSGAMYKNDFIELYNNENTPVDLAGWSVQYTSATGAGTWQLQPLTGIVPAHSFFLIQEAAGAGGTIGLPAPDVTGTIALSASTGKVLLSNSNAAQSGANPSSGLIRDKLGFGPTATAFETAPTPVTDNSSAVTRISDGVDNNNNAADFAIGIPVPRNSTYTTTAPGILSLTPPNSAIDIPYNSSLSVIFDKKIIKGTGTITVYENGVAGTPIDINDAAVVISNNTTLRFPAQLNAGKSYYVLIAAGAFKDVYNNEFAGIATATGWAFTTYNTALTVPLPANFNLQLCSGSGLLPNGFTQYSVNGSAVWDCTAFGRDPAAPAGTAPFPNGVQINGYDNALGNLVNEDWLVSPALDLTGTVYPLLSFYSRTRFNGAPLQLKVSTDYSGTGDPNLATWTDLNGKFAAQTSDTWTWSSNINLAAFKQPRVYIAFVYTSTTDDGARWTLDDIAVINSETAPPPSLSASPGSLAFFYAAAGTAITKQFTVIGNDLSGGSGINVNAIGGFEVSKDNGIFASSINFTEAEANNIPTIIYVKFAPAQNNQNFTGTVTISTAGAADTIVNVQGTSINPAKTLEVVNWNMEWFSTPDPAPGFGPSNKALQRQNAQTILPALGADLYALVEVVDTAALGNIVRTAMPGYSYIICNYGSHANPFETGTTFPTPMGFVQKEAFVYKTSVFSNIDTASLLSAGINTAADLSNPNYNNWSSGRYPFMMKADVTLDGVIKTIRFIAVHAKANTSPTLTAYDRRKNGAIALHDYLNTTFPNDNIVVLGDFNDDLDSTITDGIAPRLSSYKVFTDDVTSFYSPTLAGLSLAGKKTTVGFNEVIDHVVVSNEMQSLYMGASANVLTDVASLVPNYGTAMSDHYPVFTRFAFDAALLPVRLISFTAAREGNTVKLKWKSAEEINSREYIAERSADGVNFTGMGIVTAKGMAADYSLVDANPVAGANFYRLKPVDKDGKSTYSKVVKVNFTRLPGIRISPNPASSYVYVSLENINSAATLQLIDINGKVMQQQLITQGAVSKSISLSGLTKGLYTLKIVSQEKVITQKLVIQ